MATNVGETGTRAVQNALADMHMQTGTQKLQAGVQNKNFAPPKQRGIHDLVNEIEQLAATLEARIAAIQQRLTEFDEAHSRFYNGREV